MIDVMVNGERRTLAQPLTVASALEQWGYCGERIAVAINGEFVARGEYAARLVKARDELDIVAPVQGG